MGIANNFPVFEADQVLSNKHLNDLFNYLDQQDRLTRCKLIGSGIVCGLEIKYSQQVIHVSKGSALTSQGLMALHCESDFSHYLPYSPREFPKDLAFISQCNNTETGNIPFYKPGFADELLQLITTVEFDKLNATEKATTTALAAVPTTDLDKYAVVLFLETEELNLKNCDTNDCNDKGSRMDFDVKLLLVKKTTLDEIRKDEQETMPGNGSAEIESKNIQLKRYNVPVNNLNSSSAVLKEFTTLVNDQLLERLAKAMSNCYTNSKFMLENELQDPFANLFQSLKQLRDTIMATNPILIQYFYDFIDDLIKAYHEFMNNLVDVTSECCGNEMRFPLHVMLGEANVNTDNDRRDGYRQYFIYSSLFDSQQEKLNTIRFLFTRMKLMVEEFSTTEINDFEKKVLKITPSRYGRAALSKRCIPYYYKVAESGKELYRFWDYNKTHKGRSKFNLSYNAPKYSTADAVVNPLIYDIEEYDFFRIEGHIGKRINDALIKVKQAQQKYNLPFDTIALSADYIGALVRGEEPKCLIQDLESDYRVLIAEFVCMAHEALCLTSKVKYTGRPTVFPGIITTAIGNIRLAASIRLMNAHPGVTVGPPLAASAGFAAVAAPIGAAAATTLAAASPVVATLGSTIADDDDEDKIVINAINRLPDATDHIFVSTLVNEYQASKKYQKGDTLDRLCNPAAGLIGNKYISIIKNNNGEFRNPVTVNALGPTSALFHELFEFIDRAESVFKILMSTELADLNINDFKRAFKNFEKEVNNLKRVSPRIAAEVEMTFDSCIVERLDALKNEYLRRTAQYRMANNFNYYFKKHGGIEHKAGVPKGGTFVLVYHEERKNRFVDVRSMFVNKELSTLMMTHFHALLKPAIKVNHLEFQSKMLQTATLYKDPELYMRFKDVMHKYLDECHDLPEDRRKEITEIISKPPEQMQFELANEMVIADFYVPYLCCSDCPPITYILPNPPVDETADPTIKIDKNSFCSNDKTMFPIIVTPNGGAISGTGISVQADGSFVFIPAAAGPGLHTLAYSINGKNATVQVTVVVSPVAKFTYTTEVANQLVTLKIINGTEGRTGETTYEWLRDGSVFSTKENPDPITFKVADPVRIITLNVSNGNCPETVKEEIVFSVPVETIERIRLVECVIKEKISLEPNNAIEVTNLNTDAVITNKKTVTVDLAATLATGKKENFINYTLPGGNKKEVTLVVQSNNADFFMTIVEVRNATGAWDDSTLTLEAKNKNANTYTWTVRQGNNNVSSDKAGFTFKFKSKNFVPGDLPITVVLEVKNDNQQCNGIARFIIPNAIYQARKNNPKFDNHLQP